MRRVLFVQDSFEPPGGAHLVAAWMLQALKDDFDVTVLAWRPQDWEAVDRFYGTTLRERNFAVRVASPLVRALFALDPDPRSIQGVNCLFRWCKQIRAGFDLCVTGGPMEADFGVPGIQYCHYPWLLRLYARYGRRDHVRPTVRAMLRGRARPWMVVSGYSFERMKLNLTLVNSDWTRDEFRAGYGADAVTVYPPAPGPFPEIPWDRREDGFVCLGVLDTAKRIELMMEVLDRVRVSFPRLRLHLAGTRVGAYHRRLADLVRARATWVTLHENLSRADLLRLVTRQRYGIHAKRDEHFGIAVADMVRAGCLPFVHDSGGQVEVVMRERALIYDSADDAVRRITWVLEHPERHDELRRRLAASADRFTPRRFTERIRELARQQLATLGRVS